MLVFWGKLIKSHIFFAWGSTCKVGMTAALWAELNISSEEGSCAHGLTHALGWLGPKAVGGDAELTRPINEQLW